MSDTQSEIDDMVEKLKALRTSQLALVWPAAETAATSGEHSALVDLIKVHTAIEAIDFALANQPDPNAATRMKPGF